MNPEDTGLELLKAGSEGAARETIKQSFGILANFFPFLGSTKFAVETYKKEIQNSNLAPEIKLMLLASVKQTFKYMKNQYSVSRFAIEAAKEGTDFSCNSKVDEEWLSRFMDACKHVSNEEIQAIWGNILAGEFESPTSTPPGTIRVLSELTPGYIKAFSMICSTKVHIYIADKKTRNAECLETVYFPDSSYYQNGFPVSLHEIEELEQLGLLNYSLSGYRITLPNFDQSKKVYLVYTSGTPLLIEPSDSSICAGRIMLTDIGLKLSQFTHSTCIDGHVESIKSYLKNANVAFDELNHIKIEDIL